MHVIVFAIEVAEFQANFTRYKVVCGLLTAE